MRVGTSIRSYYAPRDPRAIAREMIEQAAAAEAAALDSLFLGDHHATGSRPYLQNVPMLARMLADWGARPAGALFLLPLWNPVLLAEQIGTLASIASGRFIAQCCVGAGPEQFDAMGADYAGRGLQFEQRFATLRALLAGREAQAGGAQISPTPSPEVEYWVGADARVALDRAARLADAWLAGPNLSAPEAQTLLAYFLERCDAHGRKPLCNPIRRNVHVVADARERSQHVDPLLGERSRGLGIHPEAVIVGTVAEVAERFRALARQGFTDVIVRHFVDDQTRILESYERLGEVRAQVLDAG